MGYFNYFIRCVIRRFVRCFFNRKTFIFLIIIALILLFSLHNYAYGASNNILSYGKIFLYKDSLNHFYSPSTKLGSGGESGITYCYYYFQSGHTYIIDGSSRVSSSYAYVLPALPLGDNEEVDVVSATVPINTRTTFYSGFSAFVVFPFTDADYVTIYDAQSDVAGAIDNLADSLLSSSTQLSLTSADFSSVAGIRPSNSYFYAYGGFTTYYELQNLETYIYDITFTVNLLNNGPVVLYYAFSDDVPALNGSCFNGGSITLNSDNRSATISLRSSTHKYLCLSYLPNAYQYDFTLIRYNKNNLAGISDNITSSAEQTQQAIQESAAATQNTIQESAAATQDTIKETSQQMQNTITDSSVNVSTDLPKDTTQDITASGFDNLFNTIRSTFTTGAAKDLVITIPFTNKSFIINSTNVYNGLNFGIIGTLINTFWWFLVSSYIVHDIYKKINAIKSGNIDSIENTNIKESML